MAGVIFDEELWAIGLILLLVLGFDLFRISEHGAELEAGKLAASEGFAPVRKKERTPILEPNRQHDEGIEWRGDGYRKKSEQDVKHSLLGRSCEAVFSLSSRS